MAFVILRNPNSKHLFTASSPIYWGCHGGSAITHSSIIRNDSSSVFVAPWWRSMATFTRTMTQKFKDAGVEVDLLGDLDTETERKLGELVLQKHGTEFYILYHCPLYIRPFYTMSCVEDPIYNKSFDIFIRGRWSKIAHSFDFSGIYKHKHSIEIYVPMNQVSEHWYLAVVLIDEKIVHMVDSLPNINNTTIREEDIREMIMQSIGLLGPAFFLTQQCKVKTPAMAALCMACIQVFSLTALKYACTSSTTG
ncbi:Aspartate--tRNA ligase 2, cytoplasmic [Linum perenne]